MRTTRREFMFGTMSAAAFTLMPRWAQGYLADPKLHYANKSVRGGGFVIGDISSGGNVLALPSDIGPILVDAKFAHTAIDLRADVKSLLAREPAMLINTHHHADHSGGNWIFKDSCKIVAHKNFNARIEGNLPQYVQQAQGFAAGLKSKNADDPKAKAASDFVEQLKSMKAEQFTSNNDLPDGLTMITHGGVQIHCRHFGNGHTDNDVVVFFPKQNILHMGDLLFHNCYPFIDRRAKANTVSWQDALRQCMKLGDEETIVIPGHGEVTDKSALPKQIEFFDQLRAIVTKAMTDGKSKDEVAAMQPEPFKDYQLQQIRAVTLRGMYEELEEATRTAD